MTKSNTISQQVRILSKLEYRKLFLVLSYTGRHKLENVMTVDGANDIFQKKDLPMSIFETAIWNTYGNKYCDKLDRSEVRYTSQELPFFVVNVKTHSFAELSLSRVPLN
ncbi:UNVERIFIED_CONTAM: putative RNA-dependent RNA polymerase 5 [Sesamum radiatum]|uniref:RNA-dependent RNA polymerase 5 n=1 Tax=Sesamum radiatum TaxID=300843 RepID=A0AAW2R3A5_SESRA